MKHNQIPIEGSDVTTIEPSGGIIHVAGIIQSPLQHIRINWVVDGASGSSECEAWKGQYEIECLIGAGYKVLSVSII